MRKKAEIMNRLGGVSEWPQVILKVLNQYCQRINCYCYLTIVAQITVDTFIK